MSFSSVVTALAPYSWYRCNEASGTTLVDSSGNSRNGTIVGTLSYQQPGFSGDSNFSELNATAGSGGFVLSGGPALTNAAFTLGFWWAPKTLSNSYLVCSQNAFNGNGQGWQLISNGSGQIILYVSNGTAMASKITFNYTSAGISTNGAPVLLWVTYDGSGNWAIYRNGNSTPLGTATSAPITAVSANPALNVSAQFNAATGGAAGYYQDIMQFSSVLSTGNMAAIYAATGAALTGATSSTSSSATVNTITWGAATNGVAPYTYTLLRGLNSSSTNAGYTQIYQGSALTYADTPPDNQLYFYRVIATDNSGTTARAPYPLVNAVLKTPVIILGIGDSRTNGYNATGGQDPMTQMNEILTASSFPLAVTTVNGGVNGQNTYQFLPGQTNWNNAISALNTAIAASPTAKVFIQIQLGTNDSNQGVSLANYLANVQSMITAIKGFNYANLAGIILHQSYYAIPGSSGVYSEDSNGLMQAYNAGLASLCDNKTVFLGDTHSFAFFAQFASTYLTFDGIHPANIGYEAVAAIWANVYLRFFPTAVSSAGAYAKTIFPGLSYTLDNEVYLETAFGTETFRKGTIISNYAQLQQLIAAGAKLVAHP